MNYSLEIAAILDNYKNVLEAECAKIKKLTSSAKPVSFIKTVLVSFFSVAVVTVVINSVSLYFTSHYFDHKLYAYAAAYKQLSELMEKNIKYLSKDKQEVVNAEFKVIKNKPSPD